MIPKPDRLFGRDVEWEELSEFVASPWPGRRWVWSTAVVGRARH